MKDRLADLGGAVPSWVNESSGDNLENDSTGGADIELGSMLSSSSKYITRVQEVDNSINRPTPSWMNPADDFKKKKCNNKNSKDTQHQRSEEIMSVFFSHVESVKSAINRVSLSTKRIKQMDDHMKLTVSEREEKNISEEIKSLIQKTNVKAKNDGKIVLNLLRKENDGYKVNKEINTSDLRKRESLVNTLTRKFIDEMKEYQSAQQAHRDNLWKKSAQQIQLVKEDATPEEVEEIMKSNGGREGLYQQFILQGKVNESIKQTYTKAAEKYQDILALEQSVAELHQMFLDFNLLTGQQGEVIDQIESNVESAIDYVEDANQDVYQAIKHSKKKKQCMVIIIVIAVAIVLLFTL